VKRYIAKHVGCRMADNGYLPSSNMIAFLNEKNYNRDLKIIFQLKPYHFGPINDPIDMIYLGPSNPINYSIFPSNDCVTSFSGWYTCANITWNYLHEKAVRLWPKTSKILNLFITDYNKMEPFTANINIDTPVKDIAPVLERFEYFPFVTEHKDIEHYTFMKNYKVNY